MAKASEIFKGNFLEYASYVIKDRAIPYIEDGFKPVQRRIIHTMIEMDDGRFQKVANIVGQVMKYHPHGDASIGDALVNLASSKYFIDTQGNFGNILTGDRAAAPRYIEARILPFAKKVLYSPEITTYEDSYDGRNKEPVVFRAKLPIVLLLGVEGIAVGMSTKILPYNPIEVIEALKCALKGEEFVLYPDFQTGGIIDVSEYDDGKGKIRIRSKIIKNEEENKLIIEEIPYSVTTDLLIENIEETTKKDKIHISSINDYTADSANIELQLAKGADINHELVALYAHTKAEIKLSLSPIVIKDNKPIVMGISEIVKDHTVSLLSILNDELDVERGHLIDKLQARTLDRIFIEERIYKSIEDKKNAEDIKNAVIDGLMKFKDEFIRELTDKDIQRLLELPIRRISLFDIEKNRQDIEEINRLIEKTDYNKSHIKKYAISVLDDIKASLPKDSERKTQIDSFEEVSVKEIATRDKVLRYDAASGTVGYGVKSGEELLNVSSYDKILFVMKDGSYRVEVAPEKLYIGKDLLYTNYADKELLSDIVFTVLFQDKTIKALMIKRCKIVSFTTSKLYSLLPEGKFRVVKISTSPEAKVSLVFKSSRAKDKDIYFSDYLVKGSSSQGNIVSRNEISKIAIKALSNVVSDNEKNNSDENTQRDLF